jgi:aldose 1-epimerase
MIKKYLFDIFQDRKVYLYELSNEKLKVGFLDFGGAIQYIKVPSKLGEKNVCLGFDNVDEYIKSQTYCGAIIGRVANRIDGARFVLNEKEVKVSANENGNCLHGGTEGFDKRFFDVEEIEGGMRLKLNSPDGDMGFEGNMQLCVEYTLKGSSFTITFTAVSDKDTLWNPTIHTYFKLDDGKIYNKYLTIYADKYTPIRAGLIPTGKLEEVENTPFDFRTPKQIGADIGADNEQLKLAGGFDHNFATRTEHSATAYCEQNGIQLDVYSDMCGVQFYSGNFIKGIGKFGRLNPRDAFCLEPQYFPNACNIESFKTPLLRANKKKKHYIRYDFSIK